MLTVGSLFAGIGGIELGLERTGGFKTVWQVECDQYAQAVLKKHWPDVGRWDDVRSFPPSPAEDWRCDVICGGFPCQDISLAGRHAGIDGERSGLWREYIRIVRAIRPGIVLVENVAALLNRGLDRVLGDLAESGYDAEWECLPAAAVGAPHIRDRLFVVAYTKGFNGARQQGRHAGERQATQRYSRLRDAADTNGHDEQAGLFRPNGKRLTVSGTRWGTDKPGLDRASYGISNRMDRLRCLGNAVVPQVAQWIGERILEAMEAT